MIFEILFGESVVNLNIWFHGVTELYNHVVISNEFPVFFIYQ